MSLRLAITLAAVLGTAPALAQHAGHDDHAMHLGASVMPFDLARSTHVFSVAADGGTQAVISKDRDAAQIALIRGHLRGEATAFARGNYADPAAIHGQSMPGLKELQAGAARIDVLYEELPDGARLHFITHDTTLVAALDRWFAAQVHDHGADAVRADPG